MTPNNMKNEQKVEAFRINHAICVQRFPDGRLRWISCSEPVEFQFDDWKTRYLAHTYAGFLPEYRECHHIPLEGEFHNGKATLVEIFGGAADVDTDRDLLLLHEANRDFWRPAEFREMFLAKADSLEFWTETSEWIFNPGEMLIARAEKDPDFKQETEEEIQRTLHEIEQWKDWQEANGGPRYSDRQIFEFMCNITPISLFRTKKGGI